MKCVFAALIVGALVPKESYDHEADIGKVLPSKTKNILTTGMVLGLFLFAIVYFWWMIAGWIKPVDFEFMKICLTSTVIMIVLGTIIGKLAEKKIKYPRL
jgi:MFS superfamily sulfate permease-like transporter